MHARFTLTQARPVSRGEEDTSQVWGYYCPHHTLDSEKGHRVGCKSRAVDAMDDVGGFYDDEIVGASLGGIVTFWLEVGAKVVM